MTKEETKIITEEIKAEEPKKRKRTAKAAGTTKKTTTRKKVAASKKTAAAKTTAKKTTTKRTTRKKAAASAKEPLMLMILDGFGYREAAEGNAILAAKTPVLDQIFEENPKTLLGASGLDVGLPDGQMGNSEVGHTNIGAGRIVYQELTRISKAIDDGDFYENPAFLDAVKNCQWNNSTLHIFCLLSDGGVHSHIDHMEALVEMAKRHGLWKVCVHCIMDGRDTPPTSGLAYIRRLQNKLKETGIGCISTIEGRYYAMDRDKRWDRVQRAYDAIVCGKAPVNTDPLDAVQKSYDAGVTDEFIEPVIVTPDGNVRQNDSVIFANFRPDRARELTRTLTDPDFDGFDREPGFFPVDYICMTQYDATMPNVQVAFQPQSLKNTFGEYISEKGLKQLRIAETEKYAHVTFFFNGGVETEYAGEDRVLIASPKVATYDLKPEMSAYEVTEEVVKRIESDLYDVIILNFANCDMVGHTGVMQAAVQAVEAVDTCVGKVVEALKAKGGKVLITADHGNADQMLEEDGVSPFTAHSVNPVPLVLVGGPEGVTLQRGVLADLAPTMLELLGLPQPEEMTGKSLLVK